MTSAEIMQSEADRRFGRTVLMLVALGFLAILIAALSAGVMMVRNQEQTRWVNHTYEVERQVTAIRLDLERMRSARRGFMLKLGPQLNVAFEDAATDLARRIEQASGLVADNAVQQRNLGELRVGASELTGILRRSMRPGSSSSQTSEDARQKAADEVQQVAEAMLGEEHRLLGIREAQQRASVSAFYVVLTIMGLLLLVVASGSVWVIRRYTRDLTQSRDELSKLNANLEGAVRERTTDLQRANEEIQRFAYIVSHDLRSPLINVMGFTAELDAATQPLRQLVDRAEAEAPHILEGEAILAVREDLPEAIGFIRTSTQKMDRLINAILRLSREGRRPIAPEAIDMDALAQGVVDTLQHRIDELGAQMRIERPLPQIVNDRLAVEQILSNLAENALKYLKPGCPGMVRISGQQRMGRVIIEVTDNGRGIEARDHERIFDLFRRSGAQDQPGEGIGLAHVRALAYRLGGTISVVSELDKGATFQLNLPAIFAGESKRGETA